MDNVELYVDILIMKLKAWVVECWSIALGGGVLVHYSYVLMYIIQTFKKIHASRKPYFASLK
jgi:hypothetical protein